MLKTMLPITAKIGINNKINNQELYRDMNYSIYTFFFFVRASVEKLVVVFHLRTPEAGTARTKGRLPGTSKKNGVNVG